MRGSHFWCVKLCDTVFNVLFISTWLVYDRSFDVPGWLSSGQYLEKKEGKNNIWSYFWLERRTK